MVEDVDMCLNVGKYRIINCQLFDHRLREDGGFLGSKVFGPILGRWRSSTVPRLIIRMILAVELVFFSNDVEISSRFGSSGAAYVGFYGPRVVGLFGWDNSKDVRRSLGLSDSIYFPPFGSFSMQCFHSREGYFVVGTTSSTRWDWADEFLANVWSGGPV